MLIGFCDDTEIYTSRKVQKPDIFVYGGYFILHERLDEFQKRISQVKQTYGLNGYAPVKWNLKDASLSRFYRNEKVLRPDEYQSLLAASDKLRLDLLHLLVEFDARIIVSARYDTALKQTSQAELFTWAFENFLQRVGLMTRSMNTGAHTSSSVILMADWPRQGVDKALMDTYVGGYQYGMGLSTFQGYHSGALHRQRFADSLYHGSTLHSGPLQLADLVVGVSREFLSWALNGDKPKKAKEYFLPIVPQFYFDPRSLKVNGNGFKLAKNPLDIDAKIAELKALP